MDAERRKVILLVEDEFLLAMDEKRQLQKYGYSVITRESGERAILALAGDASIDLVLMDINLGAGLDGTQAAAIILKDRDIPIVFLSSHVEPGIVEKTEKITSYGYVVKNSSITVLDASIKMAFKLFEAKLAEREKEQKLYQHDQYLHSILQTTVDGFWIVNLGREIIDVNDAYLRMSGYSREEFLGMGINDIDHNESAVDTRERMDFIQANGFATFETRHRRKDGSVFDVEMSVTFFGSEGGRFICFCRDITSRKLVYEELQYNEQKFRNLFDTAEVGMFRSRIEGTQMLDMNEKYLSILGRTREECIGKPSLDLWARHEDREAYIGTLRELGHVEDYECLLVKKDGSILDCITSVKLYPDIGIIEGSLIDVTEQKKAEKNLRESEERFRNLFNNSAVGMFQTRLDGSEMLDLNDKYLSILGRTREETVGKPSVDLWADPGERAAMVRTLSAEGHVDNLECRLKRKDGGIITCITSLKLYRDAGILVGSILDITERKKNEEALREREAQLTAAQAMGHTGSWVYDIAANKAWGSDESKRIFGFPPEMEDFSMETLASHIPDYERVNEALVSLITEGRPYDLDYTIQPADGSPPRYVHSIASHERDAEGRPGKVLGFIQDMSELRRSQAELEESESGLARAERVAKVGNWKLPLDSRQITASRGACDIYGVPERTLSLDYIQKSPLPEYRPMLDAALSDLVTKGTPYRAEFKIRRVSDGRIIDLRSMADYDRANRTLDGVSQDITQLNQADKALTESENRYHSYMMNAPYGIFVADDAGKYVEVNDAACEMTGYSRQELLAMTLSDLLPGHPPVSEVESFGELSRKGFVKAEKQFRHRDGSLRWFSIDAVRLSDTRRLSFTKDISERKEAEGRIALLLSEKENLLKEVHHRIKNNMGTMESLLSLQAGIVKEASAMQALKDAENRLRSMGVLYDKLYRSKNFDEVSAREYLPSLIEEVIGVFPNSDLVATRIEVEDIVLGAKTMSTLGIIMNEVITNSMKHAFPDGRKGLISLTATKRGRKVRLELADNGVGIPERIGFDSSEGFGLVLIGSLATQLGGSIDIERTGGTRFILEFDV